MKKIVMNSSHKVEAVNVGKRERSIIKLLQKVKVISLLLFSFLFTVPAYSASFDCSKASTAMEKTICSDTEISKLDEVLAKQYIENKNHLKNRQDELKGLIKSQREWLAGLRQKNQNGISCVVSKECLTNAYQQRIIELRKQLGSSTENGPIEEQVMQRLSYQLENMKTILGRSINIDVSETLSSNKPNVCEQILKTLPEVKVPKPTIFATTAQQRNEIRSRLRDMAFYNRKLFSSREGGIKNIDEYNKKGS